MRSIRKAVQERLEEKQQEREERARKDAERKRKIKEEKERVISLFIDWVATNYDVDISSLEVSTSGDDQFYLTIKVKGESIERQEKAFLDNGLLSFEDVYNESWKANRNDLYIITDNLIDAIIYAGGMMA